MIRVAIPSRSRLKPGVVAAIVHRVSGLALTFFLPAHFIVLGLVLNGANAFERFLEVTAHPLIKTLEVGLVVSLAVHLGCGVRILAIEFLSFRERTAVPVAACFGFALACGLGFLLSVQLSPS
jgi:fumarate reductase subunit D